MTRISCFANSVTTVCRIVMSSVVEMTKRFAEQISISTAHLQFPSNLFFAHTAFSQAASTSLKGTCSK